MARVNRWLRGPGMVTKETNPRADEWTLALNTIKDVTFMARNLRPRSRRALDYIESFANERLERLGAKPKTTRTEMKLMEAARAKS